MLSKRQSIGTLLIISSVIIVITFVALLARSVGIASSQEGLVDLPQFSIPSYQIGLCQTGRELVGPQMMSDGVLLPINGPSRVKGNVVTVSTIRQRNLLDYAGSTYAIPAAELPDHLRDQLPEGTDVERTVVVVMTIPHSKIEQSSVLDNYTAPENWTDIPLYQRLNTECGGLTHVTDMQNRLYTDIDNGPMMEYDWRHRVPSETVKDIDSGKAIFGGKTATETADAEYKQRFAQMASSLNATMIDNVNVVYVVNFDDAVQTSNGQSQIDISESIRKINQFS